MTGISLFISLTKALPQKVSLLGLDLSSNPKVTGWFILAVSLYFLATVLIYGSLDLIKYYLPNYIGYKTKNLTGSTIGLTEEECVYHNQPHYLDQPEVGTTSAELADITQQKIDTEKQYNSRFIKLSNFSKISFDFALPVIFNIIASYALFNFLWLT